MTEKVFYNEVSYDDGVTFWQELTNKYLLNEDNGAREYIFRGQADAEWTLLPSALREIDSTPIDEQKFYEWSMLQRFAKCCDRAGIQIPNDSYHFRRIVSNRDLIFQNNLSHKNFPSREWYELMAFAQHYKLPTRLLDWTTRLHVAIYFAASSAIKEFDENNSFKKIAIWVLDTSITNLSRDDIIFIQVPSGINQNILAQAGCFTLINPINSDEIDLVNVVKIPHMLFKYTLPVAEVEKVIKICNKHWIGASTIFPDAYGAAQEAMYE